MPTKKEAAQAVAEAERITSPNADVHHMIRKLQMELQPREGVDTVDTVDAALRNWLQSGYRLAYVSTIGTEPGAVLILYVLVKD